MSIEVITMTYNQLDNLLRQYTDSEKRHLSGLFSDYMNTPYTINKKQSQVYQFTFSNLLLNDSIMITKNQRFAPVPNHIHDYIEINYMYSGECKEWIDEKSHIIHQGQMTLIDTKTPHSIENTGENDILINFMIKKEYLSHSFLSRLNHQNLITSFFINALHEEETTLNYMIFNTENNERLQLFIHELLREYYFPSLNAKEMINSLFLLIILEMMNSLHTNVNYESINQSNSIIINALQYIENHYLECTLESTAKHVGMSACYLTTLLKKHLHASYKELIIQLKMEHAVQKLLNTDESIDNIACQSGYQNLTFFYKKFKEIYHCSPKEYRQRNRLSL